MLAAIRTAIVAAVLNLCRRLQQRADQPENKRNAGASNADAAHDHYEPETDVLHAEQAAIRATLRKVAAREEQHQTTEENFWARQIRAAHSLNWITAIGAGFAFIGSLGIIASFIIAKIAVDDARDALRLTQRPWVSAETLEIVNTPTVSSISSSQFEFSVGAILKNTGSSIAIKGFTIIHGYTGTGHGTMPDLAIHWNDSCDEASKQFNTRPADYPRPQGFIIAPGSIITDINNTSVHNISEDNAKNWRFFILGCSIYTDEFSILHHTQFCFLKKEFEPRFHTSRISALQRIRERRLEQLIPIGRAQRVTPARRETGSA